MLCPNCHAQLPENTIFCTHCGTRLAKAQTASSENIRQANPNAFASSSFANKADPSFAGFGQFSCPTDPASFAQSAAAASVSPSKIPAIPGAAHTRSAAKQAFHSVKAGKISFLQKLMSRQFLSTALLYACSALFYLFSRVQIQMYSYEVDSKLLLSAIGLGPTILLLIWTTIAVIVNLNAGKGSVKANTGWTFNLIAPIVTYLMVRIMTSAATGGALGAMLLGITSMHISVSFLRWIANLLMIVVFFWNLSSRLKARKTQETISQVARF